MSIIKECIRTVGRGSRGRGPLTQDQARLVMEQYVEGHIDDDQVAMLLMLIRVRDETAEEIAGFVEALKPKGHTIHADFDWPLYAGKRVGQTSGKPWHLLAASILAENGVKVLLHGDLDKESDRVHARDCLASLNIVKADDLTHAQQMLEQSNIAYLPLSHFCPLAKRMLDWKHRYGLRTPINTVIRALNPANAPYGMRGSFHPGFQELHAQVEHLLARHAGGEHDYKRMLSFKGQSGETEFNPKVSQTVWWVESDVVHSTYIEETMQIREEPKYCPFDTPREEWELMTNTVVATVTAALFTISGDYSLSVQKAESYWSAYCKKTHSIDVTPSAGLC
ncbi:glycosyl transferase [Vibrio sp. 10N.286.49.C2]|uniref:glycosyl transferase family protein n=1 Tax=unclassified Vibrio TaxID=2614977 RepID=UPI000C8213D2|nr:MULTISPECIES: glycosyl transferase family protein [unclassified Vibrio]PMH35127.1 glycosyl transferase [Vibrio sp. 10N.286.49.C2]PMH50931.1 glycosyl transferase [Vibrio sp. 10N.286.49.B1]PMH83582.1 glycosyl transferase [Vibrio sp. 10N.286.48.B7]